jgi:hypothetical protein
MNQSSINYSAHHSPIGAFASFTLGFRGACGGLGLELGGPANQNVYIGVESEPGLYNLLPFFDQAAGLGDAQQFDVEGNDGSIAAPSLRRVGKDEDNPRPPARIRPVPSAKIRREFGAAIDTWTAPGFSFSIASPLCGVPDPESASEDNLKLAVVPAVLCSLTVDNTEGSTARRAIFGFTGSDPYSAMRRLDDVSDSAYTGIGEGNHCAIVSRDEGVSSAMGFRIFEVLSESLPGNNAFGQGRCGTLLCEVPAGEKRTFQYAVCFHRNGIVTSGLPMRYFYTRFFPDIESVATYALENYDLLWKRAQDASMELENRALSEDQRWMLAHALRSYYGSTELLEYENKPVWVVNEGQYRMMNTFDLTVDHLFWELRRNPWVVRNQLDWFVDRYSYEDKVRFPGDKTEYPGGLSFTHDMGVTNVWSRAGYSSYEKAGLTGVFSYMTHEQLVNWLCCATVYVEQTGDTAWLEQRWSVFECCFESLLNRDHPDPEKRRGLMQLDSSRCMGGAEITTYDSLDISLGQARNNTYLAGKIWACYLALEKLFRERGDAPRAQLAQAQAERTTQTLLACVATDGTLPAVLEGDNDSRIIPVIEGLIFPYLNGCRDALQQDGPFGDFIAALRRHLDAVLQPGICLFEDGGWKLSSTSNNSWLSKIYLCQFVARQILGRERDEIDIKADTAHVSWLLDERNAPFAWSDQMLSGQAVGSKYYPRGVTSILWLHEQQ